MRKKQVKKLESMMPEGYTPNQYRKAKAIYKGNTQVPKFKQSKRQKRLAK